MFRKVGGSSVLAIKMNVFTDIYHIFSMERDSHELLVPDTLAEAYSKPCQLSEIAHFAKIVRSLNSILDVWEDSKYVSSVIAKSSHFDTK